MFDRLVALFHLFANLPASTQAILLLCAFGGFFALLGLIALVALYKPAGARIVSFLAALLTLARRKHPPQPPRHTRRRKPQPSGDAAAHETP